MAKTKAGSLPEARALFKAREEFYTQAKQLGQSLSPDPAAGEMLAKNDTAFLREERELFDAKSSVQKAEEHPGTEALFARDGGHARAELDANHHVPAAKESVAQAKAAAGKTKDSDARVTWPIEGLYDSIDPNFVPAGWRFEDTGPIAHPDHPEWLQIITRVTTPDGSTGVIDRSFDPKTKMLVMENAFLNKLPRWLDAGIPLREGKGTPTVAYLTMRQMRIMGARYGETKVVKMSTIQNVEAVMQLENLRRAGTPNSEAIAKTHSVEYASTSVQQSGQTITAVRIDDAQAFQWKLSDMMDWFKMPESERAALLAKYQLRPDDMVMVNYDVYIDLAPYPSRRSSQ